jgi:hypothetical protein
MAFDDSVVGAASGSSAKLRRAEPHESDPVSGRTRAAYVAAGPGLCEDSRMR